MRLTRIATRTGDDGSTGLGDGSRVRKDSPRITAIGEVDSLNTAIGLMLAQPLPASLAEALMATMTDIQRDLFAIGGELSIPGHMLLDDARVAALDDALATLNGPLGPLQEFILPQGTPACMQAHHARTACRAAERAVVSLATDEPVRPVVLAYLNRLSDLLFVTARALNRAAGVADVLWRERSPSP